MKKGLLSSNENKISNGGEKQNGKWNTTLATRERPSILRLMSY